MRPFSFSNLTYRNNNYVLGKMYQTLFSFIILLLLNRVVRTMTIRLVEATTLLHRLVKATILPHIPSLFESTIILTICLESEEMLCPLNHPNCFFVTRSSHIENSLQS